MSQTIPVKSDKHPQGWVLISADDFNPSKHERVKVPDVATLRITVETPAIKAILNEAAKAMEAVKAELAVKNDRIAELEAEVAALKAHTGPGTFDPTTSEDLEALKAYATERGIVFHHNAGVAKIREAIAAAKS